MEEQSKCTLIKYIFNEHQMVHFLIYLNCFFYLKFGYSPVRKYSLTNLLLNFI